METLHAGSTSKLFTRLPIYPAEEEVENMNIIARFNLRSPLSLIQFEFVLFCRSLNASIGGSFTIASVFVAILSTLSTLGLVEKVIV